MEEGQQPGTSDGSSGRGGGANRPISCDEWAVALGIEEELGRRRAAREKSAESAGGPGGGSAGAGGAGGAGGAAGAAGAAGAEDGAGTSVPPGAWAVRCAVKGDLDSTARALSWAVSATATPPCNTSAVNGGAV